MTEVWPVSSGEYSDYSVDHLFATKELAEEYLSGDGWRIGSGYSDDFTIEQPMTVIDALPTPVRWLRLQGDIGAGGRSDKQFQDGQHPHVEQGVYYPGVDNYLPKVISTREYPNVWGHGVINLTVEGSDIERVRKVYSERRAQIVATFDLLIEAEREKLRAMGWDGNSERVGTVTDFVIGSQDKS